MKSKLYSLADHLDFYLDEIEVLECDILFEFDPSKRKQSERKTQDKLCKMIHTFDSSSQPSIA